jgi:hypothetical protein
MKIVSSIFILTLAGFLFFSFSKVPVGDYRDSYCGTYICKCVFTHLNQDYTALLSDTSNAVLVVQKNVMDSMIDIITPSRTLSVKLNAGLSYYGSRAAGNFSGDSLYLKFKPSHGPQTWKYFGKK